MGIKRSVGSQFDMARNGTPLPAWWRLAALILVVVFAVGLLYRGFTGTSDSANVGIGALPDYVSGGSQTLPLPSDTPSGTSSTPAETAAASPTASQSTEPTTPTDPATTLPSDPPAGQPLILIRSNLILVDPLLDDGNTTDIDTENGPIPLPHNLMATALAAMWAEVDLDIARALPVAGGTPRPAPPKTFPNASVSNLKLGETTDYSYTFTAEVDRDGAGPKPAQTVTHTIVETDLGYLVQG